MLHSPPAELFSPLKMRDDAPHFAEVEPVELPFSTRGIPQRCLQPHILPYHQLKRWVTKAGARTIAEASSLEEEIYWTRRGGRPIHQRDLVYLVPEYTPLRKLIQGSADHSYAQPPPATQNGIPRWVHRPQSLQQQHLSR